MCVVTFLFVIGYFYVWFYIDKYHYWLFFSHLPHTLIHFPVYSYYMFRLNSGTYNITSSFSLPLPACLSVSLFLSLSISSSLSHFLSSILFPLILFFSSTSFSQPFFTSNLCLVIFVDAVRHVHCLTVSLSIPEPLDVTAEWLCDICCEVIFRGPT